VTIGDRWGQFYHVMILTVALAGGSVPNRQHRVSSGRRLPAPLE
jgi:hypothetical protein